MGNSKFTTWAEVKRKVSEQLSNEMNNQNETIWTYQELAEQLGKSVKTLQNLVSLNKIPHHKALGSTYFLKGEIIRWIKCDGEIIKELAA